jgi:Xaa-Pro aminopeptidase
LGHGIGLFPHEGPHLNPRPEWDDVFEEGDVFTVEPGLYTPEMRAGIRLENDYLVTATGVELLSDFPLEL